MNVVNLEIHIYRKIHPMSFSYDNDQNIKSKFTGANIHLIGISVFAKNYDRADDWFTYLRNK